MNNTTHYFSPKLQCKPLPGRDSWGVFANSMIQSDELLTVWGGRIVPWQQHIALNYRYHQLGIQVSDGLYLDPIGDLEPADHFNHSCEPNAGLRGQLALVALRKVEPGEQICFDYAMSTANDYFQYTCNCGAQNCRQMITGYDWNEPELWKKYKGHFSPYIQHKIERIQAGLEAEGWLTATGYDPIEIETNSRPTHYLSPKLAAGKTPNKGSNGVFAIEPIGSGELLTVWGGIIVKYADLARLDASQQEQAIQVEEGLHLAPFGPAEPADFFNHSCRPNAGLDGQNCLVALSDISTGDEVCFDYATSDSTPYDEFHCGCGEASCRTYISADDWRLPNLWDRYANHFSPYLQFRIDRLKGISV